MIARHAAEYESRLKHQVSDLPAHNEGAFNIKQIEHFLSEPMQLFHQTFPKSNFICNKSMIFMLFLKVNLKRAIQSIKSWTFLYD